MPGGTSGAMVTLNLVTGGFGGGCLGGGALGSTLGRGGSDRLGLDAGMAEEQLVRLFEIGAGESHLDGGARLASRRENGEQPGAGSAQSSN